MANDASRRWLDTSGIWSCRIKLPIDNNPKSNDDGATAARTQRSPSQVTMNLPLESTSPSARRNQVKLADAIHSMSELNNSMDPLNLPVDPDAQATVTDFLDFTEYLPSDIIRSLTLIGNLDQVYSGASSSVHELTKKYGALPTLPLNERANPVVLRKEISESLSDAISARTSAHAEASRMAENVERHYNRAKNILAKLQDMMEKYPSSRETSPVVQKSKSPLATRTPKITLRLGGDHKVRKHRAPRITVPGDVLAPFDLDYESYGSSSDDEYEAVTPRVTPARSLTATGNPKIKLKITKPKKNNNDRVEKTPRPPRPPGHVGTNAHSAIAGISTSNALALLQPPPDDAINGSSHKPWLQLTDWELANLRKRMKKNAVWSPSDTMILRELKNVGRGLDAYLAAKASAEERGVPFDQPEPPQLRGETVHAEGAISVEALHLHDSKINSNKGMKLNEAKKLKKENEAKVLAKLAADEMEQSARKTAEAANAMKNLFYKTAGKADGSSKTPSKQPAKTPAKKRKREDSIHEHDIAAPSVEVAETPKPIRPLLKRTKTETPIPVPFPISKQNGSKQNTPLPAISTNSSDVSDPPTSSSTTPVDTVPAPLPSPNKKIQTPILPPGREKRPLRNEATRIEPPQSTRPRRTSTVKAPPPVTEPASTSKRPTSSRGNADQATATIDRPRRASTARNTPAPGPENRPPSRRAKRPAPGVVTPSVEGSTTTVAVNKRSAATRKKTGTKKEKKDGREGSTVQEVYDEIDDEGNIISPDEPRYCSCNRVSFGTMIACENNDCEGEWFHLECVGLTAIPPRTTKWYCPQCRVTLGIGEKGEVSARGKKR